MRPIWCGITVVTLAVLMNIAPAEGEAQRRKTERRPYIVEIGEPYPISMERLREEAANISALSEQLQQYGYPEYAEIQEIAPEWPWDSYEVRLFYLRQNMELDFGHVLLSSAAPNFGIRKHEGPIPPEKREKIRVMLASRQPEGMATARWRGGSYLESLIARAEAAAERAQRAAERAVASSEGAVRSADRVTRTMEKMRTHAGY